MIAKNIWILFLPLFFSNCQEKFKTDTNAKAVFRQNVKEWSFSKYGSDQYGRLPATVPGTILPDLVKLDIINDPFLNSYEDSIQWVGESDWIYHSQFSIDSVLLEYPNINLVFEGLDTHTEIILNGKLLAITKNMFIRHTIPVSDALQQGTNTLEIIFRSPVRIDSIAQSKHPFLYPDSRSFTRKAPYQYGWDWGPRLISMGIWKPVYIEAFHDFTTDHIHLVTESIHEQEAFCTLRIGLNVRENVQISIEAELVEEGLTLYRGNKEISLERNVLSIPVKISRPDLWWPNGLGNAHLYDLRVKLESDETIIDTTVRFGIRKIELVQQSDSIGQSFTFNVNGRDVFIKGANYVPQHSFPSTTTREQTRQLLRDVQSVGMNMVRVWGGGIYPDDYFLDLCDSLGIMVWQDFMFACNFYPGDSVFLENVAIEAEQQVKRIGGRTCLALWCGNNEVDEAWHNWGFQESLGYTKEDQKKIWADYQAIFQKLLPKTVDRYAHHVDYIPTSPRIGWGHQEALFEGDMHYWGVWWGSEPFEIFREKTGRFMSEYGFQSFPSKELLEAYVTEKPFSFHEPGLMNHQKHPRGMALIDEYMQRDYKVPNQAEEYMYVSQLVQARGMEIAIESHRLAKPVCMGTLYWQLNDCWPAISWSGIDFSGRWKALHYKLKRLYADQLLIFTQLNDEVELFLTNEDLESIDGQLAVALMDFDGTLYMDTLINVSIGRDKTKKVWNLDKDDPPRDFVPGRFLIKASFYNKAGEELANGLLFFTHPKDLELSPARLRVSIDVESGKAIKLSMQSDKLIKDLFIKSPPSIKRISDNYFDILPGQSKEVVLFTTDQEPAEILEMLSFYCLNPGIEIIKAGD